MIPFKNNSLRSISCLPQALHKQSPTYRYDPDNQFLYKYVKGVFVYVGVFPYANNGSEAARQYENNLKHLKW